MKLLLAVVIVAALAWLVFQVAGPDAPEEGEPFLTAGGGEEPRADRVPAPPTGEAGRAQPPPSAVEGGSAHPLPAGSAPPVVSRAEVGEPLGIEGRLELREGDRTGRRVPRRPPARGVRRARRAAAAGRRGPPCQRAPGAAHLGDAGLRRRLGGAGGGGGGGVRSGACRRSTTAARAAWAIRSCSPVV